MATATHNGHHTNGRVTIDESDNPLHWLTREQIEAIGREFDELHEQVKDGLGDRDARYIRSMIGLQRRLALSGRVELFASRWRVPWVLGASTLGLAKILENMEIGHNVLHGQWGWMNDPVINSREKSKEQVRKELKGIAGKARTQIQKDYIAWPLISGLVMTLVQVAYFAAKEETERRRDRGGAVKNGLNKVRRSRAKSGSNVLKQLIARRAFREPFMRTPDRGHRREPDPQRLVLRDHLLRSLPGSDLHVHPGGDR